MADANTAPLIVGVTGLFAKADQFSGLTKLRAHQVVVMGQPADEFQVLIKALPGLVHQLFQQQSQIRVTERSLFEVPMAEILRRPTSTIDSWLTTARTIVRESSALLTESLNQTHTSITNFFRPATSS